MTTNEIERRVKRLDSDQKRRFLQYLESRHFKWFFYARERFILGLCQMQRPYLMLFPAALALCLALGNLAAYLEKL